MAKLIDLTGQRFGFLTVVKIAHIHTSPCGTKERMWTVICDCGKDFTVLGISLRHGHTKSCGANQHRFINIEGQRFGKWTVLRIADEPLMKVTPVIAGYVFVTAGTDQM